MSAFDNFAKDDIVQSIGTFIDYKKEKNPYIQFNELMKEVMEAVGYGIERALWDIENNKP